MKNPWPVALIVLIAGAFTAATWVAVTMIRQSVDLVIPDYYEQDLKHSERMAQENRARELTQPLQIRHDITTRVLTLIFPDPASTGAIQLYRPSDSSLDRHHAIDASTGGQQTLSTAGLASGLWRVNVAWRQNEKEYYHTESLVLP